jgi:rhodanese-related sulfurtransferase
MEETLSLGEWMDEASRGAAALLDVRPGHAYARGHVAHSVSAPFARGGWGRQVKQWLGDRVARIAVLADNEVVAQAAAAALAAEGLAARIFAGGPKAWQQAGATLVEVRDVTADHLARERDLWTVIDVREPYEWRSGVIPGALTVPLSQLPERVPALQLSRQYAVVCASGSRSQIAAAYLADRGYRVANLVGGMALWLAGRHPVERPTP